MIMTIAVITPFIIGVCQKQSFRLYLLVSFAWSICTLESCVAEPFSSARKCESCNKTPPFGETLLGKRGQGPQVWRVCLSVCLSLTRSQEVGPITRALQHGPYPGGLMNECREKTSGCVRRAGTFRASPPCSSNLGCSWRKHPLNLVTSVWRSGAIQRFLWAKIHSDWPVVSYRSFMTAEAVKMVRYTFHRWRSSSETDFRPIKHGKP